MLSYYHELCWIGSPEQYHHASLDLVSVNKDTVNTPDKYGPASQLTKKFRSLLELTQFFSRASRAQRHSDDCYMDGSHWSGQSDHARLRWYLNHYTEWDWLGHEVRFRGRPIEE